ncbi:MAG: neuropeptide-like protein 29 [Bacteroidota bacterium]|jgi:hypothetical protein
MTKLRFHRTLVILTLIVGIALMVTSCGPTYVRSGGYGYNRPYGYGYNYPRPYRYAVPPPVVVVPRYNSYPRRGHGGYGGRGRRW